MPALQWLGHEVWALPTVLLASRPGLGRFAAHELPRPDLAAMLAALEADGCWPTLDAVFTGYFPSPRSVAAAARGHRAHQGGQPARARAASIRSSATPAASTSPQETAEAIRDRLMPLADIATPNLFELTG